MDVVGYCTIRKGATTGMGEHLEKFIGQDLRVMEFTDDGAVLVIDREATGMATFEKEDVIRQFKCRLEGDVICPPNLNEIEKMMYYTQVVTRKGGYNNILRQMVIQASLMKGKFTDGFLFQIERDQNREKERLQNELRKQKSKPGRSNPRKLRRLLRRRVYERRPGLFD